ncbi:MAG: acetylxylan esterase [bacterium]|nr:acetylxylan esterase [bacterium]
MHLLRKQLADLASLDIPQTKRPDFDVFWDETRTRVERTPLTLQCVPRPYPLRRMEVYDVSFSGLDETPIHAWLLLPAGCTKPVPAVVHFHGAGGSRGIPASYAHWVLLGVAVLVMDFRMQAGLTGSRTGFVGAQSLGWTALGLTDKHSYYLYHVWSDALRALRVAREHPALDAARLAVDGASQGGGTALAMAALDHSVALCMADVPSACWMEKRIFDRTGGAKHIAHFLEDHPELVETVLSTVSYCDNLNLADRITCPVLMSCGLKDPVCPPETAYAVYNKISAPKEMVVYPFAEHDGGGWLHKERKLAFVQQHFNL